jgi:hypothetical protein
MAYNVLKRRQVGATGGQYGSTVGYTGYGVGAADCAPGCAPSVIGSAGTPGCGTGTMPGSECGLRVLFRRSASIAVGPAGTANIEILAGRGGAFKPRAVYMVGTATDDPSVNARLEIANVTVMGEPQLINYNGLTDVTQRGITDFYNLQCMPQPVDWAVFGSSQGQGLIIDVVNPDTAQTAYLYIALWGDAASSDLIGTR